MVQKTDSEIATKKKAKVKVDTNRDAAGSSNAAIDLTNKQGKWTGGKKRRMDRWDERPSNTDGGNGVIGEAQKLSGARSGCQLDYDWAFARGLFVLMIGRWWWFLSAAAWHALLRAAPLGVDTVESVVDLECRIWSCEFGDGVRLFSGFGVVDLELWIWSCGFGDGVRLFSSESWCMDGNLTPWSLLRGMTSTRSAVLELSH